MGCNYSCIVTKERVDVPLDVAHFRIDRVTTIPLNAAYEDVRDFLRFYLGGRLHIPQELIPDENTEFNYDEENYTVWATGDPERVLNMVNLLGLNYQTFMVMHESDWADLPVDSCRGVCESGSTLISTFSSNDNDPKYYKIDAFDYLKFKHHHVAEYHDFDAAASAYIKSIFKPTLWRYL